jgi:4-hydroxy-tetrahydrodipicolinate synthase
MIDKAFDLKGSVVPLATPLTEGAEPDFGSLDRLICFQLRNGTDALFVLGTCGEGPCFEDAQKTAVVRRAVAAAGKPVLAGIAEPGTARAARLAGMLADGGAAALVILPPTFQFAASAAEHIAHVRTIAAAAKGKPIILYNLPKKCGNENIPIAAVAELASERTIIGIKDSGGDLSYIAALMKVKEAQPAFRVMNGELRTAMAALRLGADGLVMSYTNVDPAGCVELIEAVRSGNLIRAKEIQEEFIHVWNEFPQGSSPVGKVKSILAAFGLCQPWCHPPTQAVAVRLPEPLVRVRDSVREASNQRHD